MSYRFFKFDRLKNVRQRDLSKKGRFFDNRSKPDFTTPARRSRQLGEELFVESTDMKNVFSLSISSPYY